MIPRSLSLALVFLAPILTASAALPLVENGNMSAGNDKPDHWAAQGDARLTRDTEIFNSDPAALRLDLEGGSGGIYQRLTSLPVGKFTVKGFVKAEGQFEMAQVALQYFHLGKQVGWKVVAFVKPGDWKGFEIETEPVPTASAAQVVVVAQGSGRIWLDDVSVEDAAGAENAATSPAPAEAAALPQIISANDPKLRYSGRFDWADPLAPRCSWPAAAATIKFHGRSANAVLQGKSGVRWQVVVDGVPGTIFANTGTTQVVSLARDLTPGEHTITLVKITEALFGTAAITGFQLEEDARLEKVEAPSRGIEVIGDSISAGFGNEAKDQTEKFSALTENANIAYGALAAHSLQAEYTCVAWSGKKLWPDQTIPELYARTIPTEEKSAWNFTAWQPQVVVINLGTNDFNQGNPDEAGWVAAYTGFIARIRQNYPEAFIFCAVSPMLIDKYSKSKDARSAIIRYLGRVIDECQKGGDARVAMFEFPAQTGSLGFGAAWHPSARQHEAMAAVLEKEIRSKLGW